MNMNDLTNNFSFSEVTHSDLAARLGIDNSLPAELRGVAYKTAIGMEKVRAGLGNKAISVTSWYRCLQLNQLLKSKDTSQHRRCEAVDWICPAVGTPAEICKILLTLQTLIRWDQLILEHDWIHISFNADPSGVQRGQVLSLLASGDYGVGLTNKYGVPV